MSPPRLDPDRDADIYERRKSGESLKTLGDSYGIGFRRVSSIYRRECDERGVCYCVKKEKKKWP